MTRQTPTIESKICEWCGKPFDKPKSCSKSNFENRRRFCSKECAFAAIRQDVPLRYCEECGVPIPKDSNLSWKAYASKRFCSIRCGRLHAGHGPGTLYRVSSVNGVIQGEHRHVAEQMLGRSLEPGEIVHHINGDGFDNRPDNLVVMSESMHMQFHVPKRIWIKECAVCGVEFRVEGGRQKNRKTCSKECRFALLAQRQHEYQSRVKNKVEETLMERKAHADYQVPLFDFDSADYARSVE